MKILDVIKVGPFNYKIMQNYHFGSGSGLEGHCDHDVLEVHIRGKDVNGKALMPARVEEIFIHEMLHCISYVYNNNSLSEEVVERLTFGLYQVLKDNDLLKED
jgi:hypothetical protein